MKKGSLLNLVVVMFLVTFIAGTALTIVYKYTQYPIKNTVLQREIEAIKTVLPHDFNNNPLEEKTLIGEDKLELFPARLDGVINGVAIKAFSNDGFGGKIELMVGLYLDGTVFDYQVLSHKETPGLGTKVMDEDFKSQFHGFDVKRGNMAVKQDGGDIDAVTSATISSRAVTKAIKHAVEVYYDR